MRKYSNSFLGVIFCLTFHTSIGQWQVTTGPTQPNVNSLAVNGNNIYAVAGVSNYAVSLTQNNGTNWTLENNGLSGPLYCLATSGSNVFVGGGGGTLYESVNNGGLWGNASTGLPSYNINALGVSGNNIYAATFGVYLSTNNGLSWSKLNQTWNATVTSIAISANTILAGTSSQGIYMSTNAGGNWNTINSGLPSGINAVVISDTTFIAGTNNGIYISTNNGTSWSLKSISSSISSFVVIGNNIFAGSSSGDGVFLSTNGGSLWSQVNSSLTNLTVFSLANNSQYVFAGTTGYVWRRPLSDFPTLTDTVSIVSIPSIGGSSSGSGAYLSGSSVTVQSTPSSGYTFTNWTENGNIVSSNPTYTFTINNNTNLTANFTKTSTGILVENINSRIKFYPNPAHKNIFITSDSKYLMKVFDAVGQLLNVFKIQEGNSEIEINEKGLLILIFEDENGITIERQKLIVE